MVDVSRIMEYEDDSMSAEDIVVMFQEMIDDGSVWSLQGHYGRTAAALIKTGYCRGSDTCSA